MSVVQTGDNHTIILEASIQTEFEGGSLQPGDYVGVFFEVDEEHVCAGKAMWTGENSKLIDLQNQPKGMYILHVEQAGKVAIR